MELIATHINCGRTNKYLNWGDRWHVYISVRPRQTIHLSFEHKAQSDWAWNLVINQDEVLWDVITTLGDLDIDGVEKYRMINEEMKDDSPPINGVPSPVKLMVSQIIQHYWDLHFSSWEKYKELR